jgi:transposase
LKDLRRPAFANVQDGDTPDEGAEMLGVNPAEAFAWLSMYRAGQRDIPEAGKQGGRPRKLNANHLARRLIRSQFRIELSRSSFQRLMGQLGLGVQRSLWIWTACHQTPDAVRNCLTKEHRRFCREVKACCPAIYFRDEAPVRSDAHGAKTSPPKGRTRIVSTSRARLESRKDVLSLRQCIERMLSHVASFPSAPKTESAFHFHKSMSNLLAFMLGRGASLTPSSCWSGRSGRSAISSRVGWKSVLMTGIPQSRPRSMTPGPLMIKSTRIPPS